MSQVAEQTAEVVADVVEESIDGVVDVVEVVRSNPIALAVVGVVCLATGGVGGYFFAKKKLAAFYEQLATEEIADAKVFYAGLHKVDENGDNVTPQAVFEQKHGAEAAVEATRIYRGERAAELALEEGDDNFPEGTPADIAMDEAQLKITEAKIHSVENVSSNVFVDPSFDLEEEMRFRTKTAPYIITHDEFFAGDLDYETNTLTYFEGDDTLTNEKDEPIREIDKMIGEDHLVRFGHGSKDRNIVYVRNDRLETDFEVIKSTGSFLEEVLGIVSDDSTSLKHADQRDARRAFRHGSE